MSGSKPAHLLPSGAPPAAARQPELLPRAGSLQPPSPPSPAPSSPGRPSCPLAPPGPIDRIYCLPKTFVPFVFTPQSGNAMPISLPPHPLLKTSWADSIQGRRLHKRQWLPQDRQTFRPGKPCWSWMPTRNGVHASGACRSQENTSVRLQGGVVLGLCKGKENIFKHGCSLYSIPCNELENLRPNLGVG